MKGILIQSIIIVSIVITSSIIIINMIIPILEKDQAYQKLNKAKQLMSTIDSIIRELIFEASGAKRNVKIISDFGTFSVWGKEDKIKFSFDSKIAILEPGTSIKEGNLLIVSGPLMKAYESDINHDGNMDLILENKALLFAVKKLGDSSNWVPINTTDIISLITNKLTNVSITPVTGIYINGNESSSYGNGYTELTRKGDLPSSGIKIFVNSSSIQYEALFTLSAGHDFIELEVKHIK